eukprot:jgi/Tetstr1/456508/TSEL_043230.t1
MSATDINLDGACAASNATAGSTCGLRHRLAGLGMKGCSERLAACGELVSCSLAPGAFSTHRREALAVEATSEVFVKAILRSYQARG